MESKLTDGVVHASAYVTVTVADLTLDGAVTVSECGANDGLVVELPS